MRGYIIAAAKLNWVENKMLLVVSLDDRLMLICALICSVLWRNQVDLMCLTSPKFILSIYARSVKCWASTVGVCKCNAVVCLHYLVILLTRTAHVL
jgi:hypothetical protein